MVEAVDVDEAGELVEELSREGRDDAVCVARWASSGIRFGMSWASVAGEDTWESASMMPLLRRYSCHLASLKSGGARGDVGNGGRTPGELGALLTVLGAWLTALRLECFVGGAAQEADLRGFFWSFRRVRSGGGGATEGDGVRPWSREERFARRLELRTGSCGGAVDIMVVF
jgi:hypothetical protein